MAIWYPMAKALSTIGTTKERADEPKDKREYPVTVKSAFILAFY